MKNVLKLLLYLVFLITSLNAISWWGGGGGGGNNNSQTTTQTTPPTQPGGGGGGETTPPSTCTPPNTMQNGQCVPPPKEIIIKDASADADVNKVHTKISGDSASFHIFLKDNNNSLTSGLKTLTCSINGAETKTINSDTFTWLQDGYVFEYDTTNAFPTSGNHTITCSGESTDGSSVQGSYTFYVAPASYAIKAHLNFPNASGTQAAQTGDGDKVNYNTTQTYTYDDANWTKKPVVKVGESIDLYLESVTAYNKQGQIDTGVNSDSKGDASSVTNNIQMINGTAPNTVTTSNCKTTPSYNFSDVVLKNGQLTDKTKAFSLSSTDASIGTISVAFQDQGVAQLVQTDKNNGNCDDDGFVCPMPPTIVYKFAYQIVPNNFKVELLNSNNEAIKVLYFGQGSSPTVEDTKTIRVTAIGDSNDKVITGFDSQCAAQDLDLELQFSTGLYLALKDPNGTDSNSNIVPASAFKNGVADIQKVIVVQQSKDVPFTPNMTNEPVIPNINDIQSDMQFSNFPSASTFYPGYAPNINGLSNVVILRGRINAIDTDNNGGSGTINPTKVYYEFQCNYCDLDALKKITGATDYVPSPTQQGWYIDSTFDKYNKTKITKDMITIEGGNLPITSISDVQNGMQQINYGSAAPGTYKLNIAHGDLTDGTNPKAMPTYLLYNKYWNDNVQWYTSSFIYVKSAAPTNQRDYGIDTGNAKNTRGGGRTGAY